MKVSECLFPAVSWEEHFYRHQAALPAVANFPSVENCSVPRGGQGRPCPQNPRLPLVCSAWALCHGAGLGTLRSPGFPAVR